MGSLVSGFNLRHNWRLDHVPQLADGGSADAPQLSSGGSTQVPQLAAEKSMV